MLATETHQTVGSQFPVSDQTLPGRQTQDLGKALEITHSAISDHYRNKAGLPKGKAKTGAVTLIQRFGGSLNVNPHFHQLFIDGTYELGPELEPTDFFASPSPVSW